MPATCPVSAFMTSSFSVGSNSPDIAFSSEISSPSSAFLPLVSQIRTFLSLSEAVACLTIFLTSVSPFIPKKPTPACFARVSSCSYAAGLKTSQAMRALPRPRSW